MQHCNISN